MEFNYLNSNMTANKEGNNYLAHNISNSDERIHRKSITSNNSKHANDTSSLEPTDKQKKLQDELSNNEEGFSNKKIIGKDELNAIIFKLKSYYNELNSLRVKGQNRITQLEEQNKDYDQKVKEVDNLKDINLPSTNLVVSVKNQGPFVESKEVIEKRLLKLMDKKKMLQENLLKEQEYSNTLDHMIDCEKKKMESINRKIVEFSEKCTAIRLAKKNLEENDKEYTKKIRNFSEVKKQLQKETEKLDQVVNFQTDKIEQLNQELKNDKLKLEKKKAEVDNLQVSLKSELNKRKESLIEKIKNTKAEKDSIINKENYYIKLVLGMSIIQNHFIRKFKNNSNEEFEAFNEKDVIESSDYQKFCADKFIVNDEYFTNDINLSNTSVVNSNVINNISNLNLNAQSTKSNHRSHANSIASTSQQNFYKGNPKLNLNLNQGRMSNKGNSTKRSDSMIKKHNSFRFGNKNFCKTQSMFFSNKDKAHRYRSSSMDNLQSYEGDEITTYINISELKQKFENLDITFEEIYNFYTKLNSQIAHYQNTMMTFNQKQINLETKKDMYTDKVKEILRKNYKNFDELVKNNSRFNNFMKDYQDKIKKEIELEKNGKFLNIPKNPTEYSKFYLKCSNVISEFKAFFEFIYNK